MTIIEVIIALAIMAMAIGVAVVALGAIGGARARQGANELATAVRYTYNLAAINNKTYALQINLDDGTYFAAPVSQTEACERILLAVDGKDTDRVYVQYKDAGDDGAKESDEEPEGGGFMGIVAKSGGSDPGPPSWLLSGKDKHLAKLDRMVSRSARDEGLVRNQQNGIEGGDEPAADDAAGKRSMDKRLKTYRKNRLAKPKKLPKGVVFGGIVLADGAEPVTEGTVPILFYPHGYTQRVLVYVDAAGGDKETLTVATVPMQGRAKVIPREVEASEFSDELKP